MAASKYTVLVGINYPPGDTRAEPGDVVELPRAVAKDLVDQGAIEPEAWTTERVKRAQQEADEAQAALVAATAVTHHEGVDDDGIPR